nr:unnamed protein product [Callosobruchus analis]
MSKAIKRKPLPMDSLTFEIAVKEALSMELADGQVTPINLEQGESRQHLVKLYNKGRMSVKTQNRSQNGMAQSNNQMLRKSCFRCGRKHDPEKCPAKECECFKCKKRGHTSRACRGSNVHYMGEDSQEGEQESCNEEEDQDSILLLGFVVFRTSQRKTTSRTTSLPTTTDTVNSLVYSTAGADNSPPGGIGRSPYEAMFGTPAEVGLASAGIPHDEINNLYSEEEIENFLKEIEGNSEEDKL